MKIQRLLLLVGTLAVMFGGSRDAAAQLAAPGPSGAVMGHVHIVGKDLDAQRRFWTALGATPVKNGTLELMQFPGGFIMLRQGEPMGGSVGTSVNHIGFNVKSVAEWLPKWQAAGLKMEPQTRPTQVFLIGPDDVRVEILEDAMQTMPIRFHHIHFMVPDPIAAQTYYVQTFGAVAGKRGQFDAADLPGINLTFSKADGPTVKTQGHSIDHIGFEIKGLDGFTKQFVAKGGKLDRELQKIAAADLMLSFITDPFGTYVELTEGLAPK